MWINLHLTGISLSEISVSVCPLTDDLGLIGDSERVTSEASLGQSSFGSRREEFQEFMACVDKFTTWHRPLSTLVD